jgi:hypothetical protein
VCVCVLGDPCPAETHAHTRAGVCRASLWPACLVAERERTQKETQGMQYIHCSLLPIFSPVSLTIHLCLALVLRLFVFILHV